MRGQTIYKDRATQGRDFSGLRYGQITPTDIDALIEYKNTCYVFIEAKYGNSEMPYGQRVALERLCDDLQRLKPTLLIVASHNQNSNQEIDFANSTVRMYRDNKKIWKVPDPVPSVKQMVDAFLKNF